jgi:hypothetical protein
MYHRARVVQPFLRLVKELLCRIILRGLPDTARIFGTAVAAAKLVLGCVELGSVGFLARALKSLAVGSWRDRKLMTEDTQPPMWTQILGGWPFAWGLSLQHLEDPHFSSTLYHAGAWTWGARTPGPHVADGAC